MPARPIRSLRADLAALRNFAFGHYKRCGDLLRRFHKARVALSKHPDAITIKHVYDWLLEPYSLWPVDFQGLASYLITQVESGKPIDQEFRLLLRLLGKPPKQHAQDTIAGFEHQIASGSYEKIIRCPEKFAALEAVLQYDGALSAAWMHIKRAFEPTKFANKGGVIRRRMSEERNFRRDWDFNWTQSDNRFRLLFDAMCYRWQLYGMEGDKPLLLKVTVNPTPHGTLIMIPRLWSLDRGRDLNWKAIGNLHRAHGAGRQGPKLSKGKIAMYSEAVEITKHIVEGRSAGLRGERLNTHILEKMKRSPGTDVSWIKRRLKLLRPSIALR